MFKRINAGTTLSKLKKISIVFNKHKLHLGHHTKDVPHPFSY